MKILVSPRIFPEICAILQKNGVEPVSVPCYGGLPEQVCHHPDMLFSKLSDGRLITDKNYFLKEISFFERVFGAKDVKKTGKILLSERNLGAKYPEDVLFDAIGTGKTVIGNLRYTAKEIISDAEKTINVRQGYAKCSTLVLPDAAVTADKGIADALCGIGCDVLRISAGGITLTGYGNGFIGGASVYLPERKKVVFFGNVKAHPDGDKIIAFIEKHGCTAEYPENRELTDFGGGVTI